jgi:hypothetical protein
MTCNTSYHSDSCGNEHFSDADVFVPELGMPLNEGFHHFEAFLVL